MIRNKTQLKIYYWWHCGCPFCIKINQYDICPIYFCHAIILLSFLGNVKKLINMFGTCDHVYILAWKYTYVRCTYVPSGLKVLCLQLQFEVTLEILPKSIVALWCWEINLCAGSKFGVPEWFFHSLLKFYLNIVQCLFIHCSQFYEWYAYQVLKSLFKS